MEIHQVDCPDRNEPVRMIWVDVPVSERDAARPGPAELVCLDADACAGLACNLFSVATTRMRERLERYLDGAPS